MSSLAGALATPSRTHAGPHEGGRRSNKGKATRFFFDSDGTDNGRPLYRERYVRREEETPEVYPRSTGAEQQSGACGWDDDVG
jgi:hypothetical protein